MAEAKGVVPITIEIDLDKMTEGYYSEEQINPLLEMAVKQLVTKIEGDIKEAAVEQARAEIKDQVAALVYEALSESIQPTSEWGTPNGAPTTLRDVIAKEAQSWATKKTGSYASRETNMDLLVRTEVAAALKADLQGVMNEQRVELREKMQQFAATLLADKATR